MVTVIELRDKGGKVLVEAIPQEPNDPALDVPSTQEELALVHAIWEKVDEKDFPYGVKYRFHLGGADRQTLKDSKDIKGEFSVAKVRESPIRVGSDEELARAKKGEKLG